MIRVMVCEDVSDIRKYYIEHIDGQPDMCVVCEASNTEEAVQKALENRPDIILMDISMDEINSGVLATERICHILPETKVIMLTIHDDDDLIVEAYLAGAVDYMIKNSNASMICDNIRKTFVTEEFLGRKVAEALRKRIKKAQMKEVSLIYLINSLSKLTATEKTILDQLYKKKKRKEIAAENYMSEETVKIHIRHILRKLNFSTTSEMITELNRMGVMEFFS